MGKKKEKDHTVEDFKKSLEKKDKPASLDDFKKEGKKPHKKAHKSELKHAEKFLKKIEKATTKKVAPESKD